MDILAEQHYDHTVAEPHWAAFWEETAIYRYRPGRTAPVFSVDTPPPYASAAHLHAGHAMSYTQAEIIVRQRRMHGDNICYPMGFDDNGLPTERYVETKYAIDKAKMTRPEFIALCLRETREIGETYRRFWRMLGISVDWSLEYSTISPPAVQLAQASFLDLYRQGLAVRKEEPVMWDTAMTTTLAQADLETIERAGQLYDIVFTAEDGAPLTIATTRPELLPACVALCCHPDDPRYAPRLGTTARVPLFDYPVPILADPAVSRDFGSGLMMVCTFGDGEDVVKWRTHRLPLRVVITEHGRLNDLAGPFAGLSLSAARRAVVEHLQAEGYLTGQRTVQQHVSVAERSKTPVEYLPRRQWFIALLPHQAEFLRRGEALHWFPEHFRTRYEEWVHGLQWDWCISRQRFYGVPIPVWYCATCGAVRVAREEELPLDPTTTAPIGACEHCGGETFTPEQDVFDTWMTSSLTPMLNAGFRLVGGRWQAARPELYPASLRVQAFEIIRTWLFYTIVKGTYHTGQLPWHDAMISGWGLDATGHKISKRAGNYQDPAEIVARYSADALRYWCAQGALGQDLRYNEEEVKKGRRLQTKLFNATKLLAMATGTAYQYAGVPQRGVLPVDHWLLAEGDQVIREATARFAIYDYANALRGIEAFFWATLCDHALEMLKTRLRGDTDSAGYTTEERQAGAAVTFTVLYTCVQMLAPFLPFVTEHVYQGYFRQALGEEAPVSIHVSRWPAPVLPGVDAEAVEEGRQVMRIIHALRKAKTEARRHIGSPVAAAMISAPPEMCAAGQRFTREIASAVRATRLTWQAAETLTVELP